MGDQESSVPHNVVVETRIWGPTRALQYSGVCLAVAAGAYRLGFAAVQNAFVLQNLQSGGSESKSTKVTTVQ